MLAKLDSRSTDPSIRAPQLAASFVPDQSNQSALPPSRITGGQTRPFFQAVVLGKYNVNYYQCQDTGFVQTESPYWLDEAYADAITALDIGLVSRNADKAALTKSIISDCFPRAERFVDYGGGYGMFTRMMRDHGFPFLHYDTHCQNIFARGFEVDCLDELSNTGLITAWEVMEHLVDPLRDVKTILEKANTFLFSTELIPDKRIAKPEDWWYFTPETGQHISIYTLESLEYLAKSLNAFLYTDGSSNHILSMVQARDNPFETRASAKPPSLLQKARSVFGKKQTPKRERPSLLQEDFELALERLRAQQSSARCSNE
ncbi:class I SAM-dependent methyltransferase [Neorhodopirellula lusitana]|uniref:class I SAM-dependent methyltransferase n=1 Tax=Neorhodopirellula lusitana TaxID=445327 RepID=UPI00384DB6EC